MAKTTAIIAWANNGVGRAVFYFAGQCVTPSEVLTLSATLTGRNDKPEQRKRQSCAREIFDVNREVSWRYTSYGNMAVVYMSTRSA